MKSDKVRDIWIYQKQTPSQLLQSAQQSLLRSKALTNPPIHVEKIDSRGNSYTLFDDGKCLGGSKQRLLGVLLGETKEKEVS